MELLDCCTDFIDTLLRDMRCPDQPDFCHGEPGTGIRNYSPSNQIKDEVEAVGRMMPADVRGTRTGGSPRWVRTGRAIFRIRLDQSNVEQL
jgi:hypothetical protein